MEKVYSRPVCLTDKPTGYCPGCLHGAITQMIGRVVDSLQLQDKIIGVLPVGCSTMGTRSFDFDMVCSAHGRAPAVATGVKRCAPDRVVFTYQGDGDLAAIGLSEIIHCANRGENIVVIFVNNSIYGMTGGQMAPTTLVGMRSTTTPGGRDSSINGYPMRMCEIISQLDAPAYVARFALDCPKNLMKAEKGLRRAFEAQLAGKGFCFIELLSNCPTNWGLSPEKCLDWMRENTMKVFPVGEFKVKEGV